MATTVAEELTKTAASLRSRVTCTLSTLDILIYALDTRSSTIAKTARLIINEDLWNRQLSPYKLLSALDGYGEGELVAVAYYQILLKGMDDWISEEELDKSHHHALFIGIARLSAEWDSIFSDWGTAFYVGTRHDHQYYPNTNHYTPQTIGCLIYGEILGKIWSALAAQKLHSFDVIGRLNVVKAMTSLDRYKDLVLPNVDSQLSRVKRTLYSFFRDSRYPQETERSGEEDNIGAQTQ